jgi:hypothetical protein
MPASMLGVPISSAINNDMFCCYYYVQCVMQIKCTLNSNTLSMFHFDDHYIYIYIYISIEEVGDVSVLCQVFLK